MNTTLKIAVLIDGDNANSKLIEKILHEVSQYGDIVIKKVYGDFSKQSLFSWKSFVIKFAIQPEHCFNFSKGKNSTDIHLIINAMDIIYTNQINAICIVSSDCDFTGLILRAKINNLFTIGVGKMQSCTPYKDACDIFIIEEDLIIQTKFPQPIKKEENLVVQTNGEVFRIPTEKLKGLRIVGKLDI